MSKNIFNKIHLGHIRTPSANKSGVGICASGFGKVIGINTSQGKASGTIFGIKWNDTSKKIFGIGLGKTGTTSLAGGLVRLGFNHFHQPITLLKPNYDGNKEALYEVVDRFDSFDDFPWPSLYKDLFARYPYSKFILTTRKTPEVWYESLKNHYLKSGKNGADAWRFVFGEMRVVEDRDRLIALYNDHITDVKFFFKDKPGKLLEVCWENGDSWPELCSFLDIAVPVIPFPHANRK